jgi:hypothetical protein
MTKSLRKKHLLIWSVCAVLLPVGIITAYSSVEKAATTDSMLQPAKVEALPIVLKQKETSDYSIAIRTNKDSSQLQLEWQNKQILKVPTAVIYQSAKNETNISKAKAVGRIEGRGNFYFTVDSTFTGSNYQLLVYDFIHQQLIETINF